MRANYDDETRVRITTEHGTEVLTRGEQIGYECPVCGLETAGVVTRNGNREWHHGAEDRTCPLEVSDSAE